MGDFALASTFDTGWHPPGHPVLLANLLHILLTSVNWVVAGHEGGPARGADGVDVVVVEDEARVGERVDVGRRHLNGLDKKRGTHFWNLPLSRPYLGSSRGSRRRSSRGRPRR